MAKKKRAKSTKPPALTAVSASIADSINSEVIADALNSVNQTALMKVCRLCETKDGPFLNIFDADKVTAKKIDTLMPFVVAENDELPHKICFRCSAKMEELHEFVQKCIKTQESLHKALNKGPVVTKLKTRKLWEEKLSESNMSNDDICDALIKKAMEGIKDIPLNPPIDDDKPLSVMKTKKDTRKRIESENEGKDNTEVPMKQMKLSIDKCDQLISSGKLLMASTSELSTKDTEDKNNKLSTKTASNKKIQENEEVSLVSKITKPNKKSIDDEVSLNGSKIIQEVNNSNKIDSKDKSNVNVMKTNKFSLEEVPSNKEEGAKSFNIMDHVSIIKVNGVGILFQCKICNRNFLKREVVLSHACAKNGVPKVDFTKNIPVPPEPPKPPTVKYINTKIDGEIRKPLDMNMNSDLEIKKPTASELKPKPKIGPASKVKRDTVDSSPSVGMKVTPRESTPPPIKPASALPSVQVPSAPNVNSRYKLVPGPNNTYTLVEEQSNQNSNVTVTKSKSGLSISRSQSLKLNPQQQTAYSEQTVPKNKTKESSSTFIDLESQSNPSSQNQVAQPYPVGLFQTMPHHSNDFPTPVNPEPVSFTTPAMKKQSYTVVRTGNPSKLLISAKPQPSIEEPQKKKQKKKAEIKQNEPESKQPFSVTLEDVTPPKDPGFFTFINVDPLLQPSYVLPTASIIQESQISTSTPIAQSVSDAKNTNNNYSCGMCSESFSREKKLLAHIQSHFSKINDDQLTAERNTKKRVRK